ncbi:acyl carrier protein, partial [Campylobacter coli]|nr:acyl carrier protein [Campylobacter coli]
MTAYVHIGTMKTGTSSIQNFLYLNRSLLQKQNYYYPISIKNIGRL